MKPWMKYGQALTNGMKGAFQQWRPRRRRYWSRRVARLRARAIRLENA